MLELRGNNTSRLTCNIVEQPLAYAAITTLKSKDIICALAEA
jgi:hypothetical protein